jgi:competence protein ComEC
MQDRIFYFICFGFVFGILFRSLAHIDSYLSIVFGIITLALLLFFTIISRNSWGVLVSIFILSFSFGVLRFNSTDISAPNIFEQNVGKKVSLAGEIVDDPSIGEKNQKLVVQVWIEEEKTKILASVPTFVDYKYGDELSVMGKLEKPENFATGGGKEFDYINYLRKDGIFYIMNFPDIEVVSTGRGNFIRSRLFAFKNYFLEKIDLAIRSPESLLMGGLILGEKASFSDELRQSFIDTGTIHIVALSGYNITIIAEYFMKLFVFLPQGLGIWMGILVIFLFILMTGGGSTAVRAGVMATLALYARWSGRNYDVGRALLLAGVFMILFNPFVLVFDVSFQLSFIATIALIFFTPKVERYFMWVPKYFGLRDIVSVTFAVYIFVLPFILYKMGNLSLVALPANVLVLPFIPITMLFGFLTGFFGLIHYFVSVPFGFISYALLHYELGVISFFSKIPFASLTIPNFPLALTIIIYLYFVYRLFGRNIRNFLTVPF